MFKKLTYNRAKYTNQKLASEVLGEVSVLCGHFHTVWFVSSLRHHRNPSQLVWMGADYSSWGSVLHRFQSLLSSLKAARIWYSGDTFPVAYFVEVCLRCCARVAFPNRHTNPAFSPLAFLCQTRQTNPDERLLEKCCFDMTATPSCYCHESAWHVSNDVATSATQLFFFPLQPYSLSDFQTFYFSLFFVFVLHPSSTSHSSHW